MELIQDMKYFLAVASNDTNTKDSYSSAGKVMRVATPTAATSYSDKPLHPFTPFQMSTPDSNDWTRKRKGGWWLRRGLRVDARRFYGSEGPDARTQPEVHGRVGELLDSRSQQA